VLSSVKNGWNGEHPKQKKLINEGYLIKQEEVNNSDNLSFIISSWTELQQAPVLYL